ncbi:DUF2947 family protein [Marinomonas dokdonensis]|uniref:DUF2947 family protein n=1 Tax=Marinomonas dokdonensis TaxID=328224 RepID=UPI0040559459
MSYRPLEEFSKYWIFKRDDPKIDTDDLAAIRLLSEAKAANIWRDYISDGQIHPDHLTEQDWVKSDTALQAKLDWEKRWDSDRLELPEESLEHFSAWGEDTLVYFCCHNELVFELPWGVFKRSWKAFLFMDNGPILVGRKKKQAAQFYSNGWMHLLLRN